MSPGPYSGLTGPWPRDPTTGALLVSGAGGGGGGTTVQHNGSTVSNPNFVDATLSDLTALGAAAGLVPTAVKTGAYTAAVSDFVPVDASSGSVTITLPTAPADKTRIGVKVVAVSGTNTVTIAAGGSDVFNKAGGSTSVSLSLLNQGTVLQYKSSTGIWYVQSGDTPLSQLDARYPVLIGGRVPVSKLASGTPDGTQFVRDDGTLAVPAGGGGGSISDGSVTPQKLSQAARLKYRATNVLAQTIDRDDATTTTTIVTGVPRWTRLDMPGGVTLTTLRAHVGTTAAGTPTHGWMALLDAAGVVLAVTADELTNAWAASTTKSLTLGTPYTPSSLVEGYLAVCVTATTTPILIAKTGPVLPVRDLAPIISGSGGAGQQAPPSVGATLSAPTSGSGPVFAEAL